MKKLLLALLCTTLIASISQAQSPSPAPVAPEKRAEIEKLLKLTGTEKLMAQMMTQMIASLKAQTPDAPEEFWVKFQQKMDTHAFIEKVIPVYDKYYTLDDLKAINAFYESPVGAKVLASLPQIMQESMKIGQAWGMSIGQQAMEEIKQEQAAKEKPAP